MLSVDRFCFNSVEKSNCEEVYESVSLYHSVEHVEEQLACEPAGDPEVPRSVEKFKETDLPIHFLDVIINVWKEIIAPAGNFVISVES